MPSAIEQNTPSGTGVEASFSTMTLFVTLAAISTVLVWANNEFVMTKDVFEALVTSTSQDARATIQYEAIQSTAVWGYLFAPLQTAFRIGFVALLVQMMCLIGGVEISYGKLFRVAAVAFGAMLFGSALQILWITLQPADAITQASLGIVPDSLAAWFGASAEIPTLVYLTLSRASITSLLWMMLLYWGLRETDRLGRSEAGMVTIFTWLSLSALHVGTMMFARGLVS